MENEALTGLWIGHYQYGRSYPANFRNRKDWFDLDVLFDGVNFRGICRDGITMNELHEPAIVVGICDGLQISFIKKYSCYITVDENERSTIFRSQPAVDIHYTGNSYKRLFSKALRFKGEWNMTCDFLNETGITETYMLDGTWAMRQATPAELSKLKNRTHF